MTPDPSIIDLLRSIELAAWLSVAMLVILIIGSAKTGKKDF